MSEQEPNLLIIFLDEPIPGKVNTRMASDHGDEEASVRYRAMTSVLLQQLEGLNNTRVRFCYSPDDAGEAISFWVLPLLRGHVIKRGQSFLYTPERNATAFNIEFAPQGEGPEHERLKRTTEQAFKDGFSKVASIHSNCIQCGSRWINAAFLQTKDNTCTIGPAPDDEHYLLATTQFYPELFSPEQPPQAVAESLGLKLITLPELPKIHTSAHWDQTLEDPIGGKLKAAHKKES